MSARRLRSLACGALLLAAPPLVAGGAAVAPPASDARVATVAASEVDAIVTEIVRLFRAHYVIEERVAATVERLEHARARGRYRGLDATALATALTADLRGASGDGHNYVGVVADDAAGADAWVARERLEEQDTNFGVPRVETFRGGIGYVRIASFMEPQRTQRTLAAAMQLVSGARALVFDLRGNGGGYGGLPELLATWFFDEGPTLLSTLDARESAGRAATTTYTVPAVPGTRRVGIPVYVLVDRGTASAAEWFAYTLQAFGKARIVGETTAGAAHMNSYFPLTSTLRLSLSTARPVSAATGTNWEGKGVQPDLRCDPQQALEVALAAARRRIG